MLAVGSAASILTHSLLFTWFCVGLKFISWFATIVVKENKDLPTSICTHVALSHILVVFGAVLVSNQAWPITFYEGAVSPLITWLFFTVFIVPLLSITLTI
jgi:uncharacterized membrane protein YagU involved in acid resistance